MIYWIDQNKFPLAFLYGLLAIALSFVIKQDAFMLLNFALTGAVATYVLLKKSNLLLMTTVLLSIFNEGITQFNVTYIIFYLYILMAVSILTNKEKNKIHAAIFIAVALSLVLGIIPAIINGTSIPLLVISILKRYGFLIIFIYALNIMELNQNYRKVFDISLIILLILNFAAAFLQFLQGEKTQDDITGLMGTGTTGIFIYLLMYYLAIISGLHYQKKISTFLYFAFAMVPIVYSAFAEVKIGFVSSAVILIVYLVFIKRGFKAFSVLLIMSFMLIWFYSYFVSLYPEHDFLSEDFLKNYLVESSYGDESTLNRFGFKPTIDALVFSNSPNDMLFGKGLGSGNPSDTPILQGEEYKKYDFLKYSWFLMPYLYIETGSLGLVLYFTVYLIPIIIALKHFMKAGSSLSMVVLLMGLMNLLFIPYNTGLLTYAVTTVYWVYTAMLLQEIHQVSLPKENDAAIK